MSKVYIMVGLPASGKSTIAKKLMKEGETVYVSRDEIRYSKIKEGEAFFSKEKEVYREFIDRIQSAIDDNRDVIADATHINKASRAKLLRSLNISNAEVVAVYVHSPLRFCLDRNEKREGRAKVPEDAMYDMSKWFKVPELSEGFNAILTIDNIFENKK